VLAIDRKLEPAERTELLERFQPTIAVHSPARHEAFLDELEERDIRLTGLRNAASTGARLSPALARRFRELTGVPLLDGYGTAETGVIAYHHPGGRAPNDSIGIPASGHLVAPVDDRGMVAGVGVVGDLGIYGRPPSLCSSYWTGWPPGEELVDGSWTLTGDRAFFDQVGELRLDEDPQGPALAQVSHEEGALLWRAAPIGVGAAMDAALPPEQSALT
jgi:acyl-coenzyme A synthetase/AMP-(fatty) acid ligase